MGDEGRNPIDFGSQRQRSRPNFAPGEGMPCFALSSFAHVDRYVVLLHFFQCITPESFAKKASNLVGTKSLIS